MFTFLLIVFNKQAVHERCVKVTAGKEERRERERKNRRRMKIGSKVKIKERKKERKIKETSRRYMKDRRKSKERKWKGGEGIRRKDK